MEQRNGVYLARLYSYSQNWNWLERPSSTLQWRHWSQPFILFFKNFLVEIWSVLIGSFSCGNVVSPLGSILKINLLREGTQEIKGHGDSFLGLLVLSSLSGFVHGEFFCKQFFLTDFVNPLTPEPPVWNWRVKSSGIKSHSHGSIG